MKILLSKDFDVKVHFVLEDENLSMLSDAKREYAKNTLKFKGEKKSVYTDLGPGTDNLIVVGLGKHEDLNHDIFRIAANIAAKTLDSNKVKEASLILKKYEDFCTRKMTKSYIEGFLQSDYVFDEYLTKKTERNLETISIIPIEGKEESAELALNETTGLMEGINLTRKLVNTPSIDMYPEVLAKVAVDELSGLGVEVEVFDREKIEELGMKAFLAVAEGSEKEPKFIVMKYLPKGEDVPAITLVGKGLTYDSGGYALKPADGMYTMKSDMAGSASVVGAIYALAKNKTENNVIGIIAACENMISGGAYKNGDIISSMKGTSIDVVNTDAEGRLTLADAIYYAATKVNSSCIIDIATLTGACVVAFGEYTVGAVTNNKPLYNEVKKAAKRSGEHLWLFPSFDEMRELLKADFADLKNSTGRFGGAITAGLFLEHFAEEKPWVHLDIAGPSYSAKGWGYLPKGATGIPVKTLYDFVARKDMPVDEKYHKKK